MEIREKILSIAFKLFIETGFWEVSIKDILKEVGVSKDDFYNLFVSKDHLIYETIHNNYYKRFDNIIKNIDGNKISSKDSLFRIFCKYSEIESYLQNNFNIQKFNYESIIFLTIEGRKEYELTSKYIADFNERLLEKIELIIEEGKETGEIIRSINSEILGIKIVELLRNSTMLWAMNQNVEIKTLFETDFKYLWNGIKAQSNK